MSARGPALSVVVPVYNGGPFIARALDSILSQGYGDFELIVVDNRSTDDTRDIVETYRSRDRRIRLVSHQAFVDCEENHNRCFREIGPDSAYCKVVSADDWLQPEALRKFMDFAVAHPGVGIVGSYQLSSGSVRWRGLPEDVQVLSGRDAARLGLLDDVHVFGNPMSVLYRSDLLRATPSFFPHSRAHADTSAVYASLRSCDFGFIHEVLSVEYVHEGQLTAQVIRLGASALASLDILAHYGRHFLTEAEFRRREAELEADYYDSLGRALLRLRGRSYWRYHRSELAEMNRNLEASRVALAAARSLMRGLRDPQRIPDKLRTAVFRKD